MSAKKLERLVNLLLLLLSTRRPLTVEEIRRMHPAYGQGDPEAFRRMFERDKDELRELGVPLETAFTDAWETDQGYWVRKGDYELPPLELLPDEAAAVALAARLWQSAGLADASASALRKLQAAGIEADPVRSVGVEPRVSTSDPAFEPCLAAVRARQPLRFTYQGAGGGGAQVRNVDPWQVVHRRGRWYLVGHDRDRGAPRAFRLDRVVGMPSASGAAGSAGVAPAGFDPAASIAGFEVGPQDAVAQVRVTDGCCWELRRSATSTTEDDGSSVLELPMGDVDRMADWVIGFGADAIALSPPELRAAVVARLQDVLGESA
jgi:proteasome accessory factor B